MVSSITTIHTTDSYAPNGQVWIAGQIAADVDGNLIKGSMTEQAHQICKNIDEILKAAGSDLKRTVKVTVFVTDFDQLPEFNAVYNTYFPHKPPRTSVEVSRLPLDVTAEVDIIAVTK
ncbi:L-PSP endoribonuclease family protein-like protein [Penicillium malachiteum]|uniref:L-PSP endoribonuclease family protein-like protein n=1 Tax=Penicillium malachiteum TaxID=1324776 RepID=UPI002546E207|nr:L-PSP endoribonuclease family protein-like protein [Penicillium malachiteum]KAJ5718838.1 L-PSP endoribonuclease family protein-like protein [Penicillium malachiteum]